MIYIQTFFASTLNTLHHIENLHLFVSQLFKILFRFSVVFHFCFFFYIFAFMSLAEVSTWTFPIPPSVPSMGCPSTAQEHCTQLTSPLHMSLWWGRHLPVRWAVTTNSIFTELYSLKDSIKESTMLHVTEHHVKFFVFRGNMVNMQMCV